MDLTLLLLNLILMVVEPFNFYFVALNEVNGTCVVDFNNSNFCYVIYLLHFFLFILISISLYHQHSFLRLYSSTKVVEHFPVVFDFACLFFSTVVAVTSTRLIEAAAATPHVIMLVYAFTYVLRSTRLPFCRFSFSSTWPHQVFFVLIQYVLGAHLFGSLYYVFAIKEKLDSCGLNNYGIYKYAFRHGLHRRHTSLITKSYSCFQWGLQNLFYLGKNLQPTDNTSQNLLVIFIVLSSALFWAFLLGSLQIYFRLQRNPDGVRLRRN